jgi:H+/Cl- antiporter ClcA
LKTSKRLLAQALGWIVVILLIGVSSGLASAFFLEALGWITNYRAAHPFIIWFLPLGGLCIGFVYHLYGKEIVKGNNLILEEYENPQRPIPLIMAPLILVCTLITHLFGGSAGREGTAVQMATAIADRFTSLFQFEPHERKTILILGISAGFAAVFGTPVTAAVFALELMTFKRIRLQSILPAFLVAYIAYYTVAALQVQHVHYAIPSIPQLTVTNGFWAVVTGIAFGLAAMLFTKNIQLWENIFSKYIPFALLRPFFGGFLIVLAIMIIGPEYAGLGIPTILASFTHYQDFTVFLFKILITGCTLGAGFKGGEVTPLFFTGAALGSALSLFVPLPMGLLAGMGFVAVFSGATHTPIACTIMGMELFGYECGIYTGIACLMAYYCSGTSGIYKSQVIEGSKIRLYQKLKRYTLF